MEPEGSLRHSQMSASCPYPEQYNRSTERNMATLLAKITLRNSSNSSLLRQYTDLCIQ